MPANTNIVHAQLKRRSLLLLIIAITLSIGISATAITSYNILKNMLLSSNPQLAAITQQMVSQHTNIELLQLDGKWNYIALSTITLKPWTVSH